MNIKNKIRNIFSKYQLNVKEIDEKINIYTSSYNEFIENGINNKDALKMLKEDIERDVANSKYTLKESSKACKILLIGLISILSIIQLLFLILENVEWCLTFPFYYNNRLAFHISYLLLMILSYITVIVLNKNIYWEKVKSIKDILFFILIQFIPILFNLEHGVYDELFNDLYYFSYFMFLPISLLLTTIQKNIREKKYFNNFDNISFGTMYCVLYFYKYINYGGHIVQFNGILLGSFILFILYKFIYSIICYFKNEFFKKNKKNIIIVIIGTLILLMIKELDRVLSNIVLFSHVKENALNNFMFTEGFLFLLIVFIGILILKSNKLKNYVVSCKNIYCLFFVIYFVRIYFVESSEYYVIILELTEKNNEIQYLNSSFPVSFMFGFLISGYMILNLIHQSKVQNCYEEIFSYLDVYKNKLQKKVMKMTNDYTLENELRRDILQSCLEQYDKYLLENDNQSAYQMSLNEMKRMLRESYFDKGTKSQDIKLVSWLVVLGISTICIIIEKIFNFGIVVGEYDLNVFGLIMIAIPVITVIYLIIQYVKFTKIRFSIPFILGLVITIADVVYLCFSVKIV